MLKCKNKQTKKTPIMSVKKLCVCCNVCACLNKEYRMQEFKMINIVECQVAITIVVITAVVVVVV